MTSTLKVHSTRLSCQSPTHRKSGSTIISTLRNSSMHIIGASLSEPHTSGTALRKCVNMCLLAAIYRKFLMSAFKYFTNIDLSCTKQAHEGYCPSAASTTRSEVKHAWQLLVCTSTDHQRQAAHRRYKCGQWLRLLQVGQVMHGMNGSRNPAHDFIVKLSPCTCSYLAALAGEMAGI